MPITRTPIIDDSGWGDDGTVIDNAWKQQFYDQIDAFAGGVYGAFTPVEHYASAAVNGEGVYGKFGRLVIVQMQLFFPAISGNTNPTWFDGLPFGVKGPDAGGSAGLVQAKGVLRVWQANAASFYAYDITTGSNVLLNSMSGAHVMLSGSYLTT